MAKKPNPDNQSLYYEACYVISGFLFVSVGSLQLHDHCKTAKWVITKKLLLKEYTLSKDWRKE